MNPNLPHLHTALNALKLTCSPSFHLEDDPADYVGIVFADPEDYALANAVEKLANAFGWGLVSETDECAHLIWPHQRGE